jgi:hypothetical protein
MPRENLARSLKHTWAYMNKRQNYICIICLVLLRPLISWAAGPNLKKKKKFVPLTKCLSDWEGILRLLLLFFGNIPNEGPFEFEIVGHGQLNLSLGTMQY